MKTNKDTYMQKRAEVDRNWHVVDVQGKILGQVATDIAKKLIGKDKATFTPHIDGGDFVIVLNSAGVMVTRNKAQDKIYYNYSGFPGGLRKRTFAEIQDTNPQEIIERAVYNMLPKNKLRAGRMTRLKVYAGAEHPHQSQLSSNVTE